MCGILAGSFLNLQEEHVNIIEKLFINSQIRGKHATGISYCYGENLETIIFPIPAKEFITKIDLRKFIGTNFSFIGHCRYSTSDLEYNQPIADEHISIVHNGVVTQERFERWEELFGYTNFITKNDSELIFKAHGANLQPMDVYQNASMAVAVLTKKSIKFYRNGLRPLHYSLITDGLILASTSDIIKRSTLVSKIFDTKPGIEYNFMDNNLTNRSIVSRIEDLQNV